ncbi:MlaD family protein [Deminuibacter soli]|uniref:MCE family protein n=1 Tax=Deminuibacter soli TaxID=2291815 RepID=A0A3E1NGL5_9BACT|nr:MlaD family protein [Deminuibacter soli]RFM27100.1 MCE family protein [Deminuibacter soli]
MKVSNETKIGALTVIAVALLFLGFNFLKGKSLFKSGHFLYAKYADTKGLVSSNAVMINGYQAGTVNDIQTQNGDLQQIVVTIKLNEDYHIPVNSVASIASNPLGSPNVEIKLGNATTFLKAGDTVLTANNGGVLGELTNKVGPVADQLKATLSSLDTVLKNVNTVLDPATKGNLQSVIGNLSKATAGLVTASASLQTLLNNETGALSQSLNNVNSFTKNLADNNSKISGVMDNLEATTNHLSKADIDGVVNKLKASVDNLNNAMTKLNSTDGSMGALINDKTLYNNLNSTIRSLNTLMDDFRLHPKRYVSLSVFGKKDKSTPLAGPTDSTYKTTTPTNH